MNDLIPVEHNNQRVMLTAQVAEFYGSDADNIVYNFNYNKNKYVLGKDYFVLKGTELKEFLILYPGISNSQNLSKIRSLYLWTEGGALLHAKSLNTEKAWEVFFKLRESYFVIQQQQKQELPVYFNKQTQDRCRTNEELLPEGYWCVETEMVSQACTLQVLQKELKHWCLPAGSGGKAWINHLRKINHPLLDEDSKVKLWVPNLPYPTKIMVYPYALLSDFRRWLRVEYAEYYDTKYSPSRLKSTDHKQIS